MHYFTALLMMASGLSGIASAARRSPSFIPVLDRHVRGRSYFPCRTLSIATSTNTDADVIASSPFQQPRQKIYLRAHHHHHHSLRRWRKIKSQQTCLRSSSSHFTTTSHTESFTWPQLIDLFRTPDAVDVDVDADNQDDDDANFIPSDHPNLELFRRATATQTSYENHKQNLDDNWRSAYDYMVVSKFGEEYGFEKVMVKRDCSDPIPMEEGSTQNNCNKNGIPPNGFMYQAQPSLTEASKYTIENGITYLRLVLNDFPYDVEEGIEHWCLWKIGGKCSTEGILREELMWALKELESLQADDEKSGSGCIVEGMKRTTSFRTPYSQTPEDDDSAQKQKPVSISDSLYWVNPPALQSMPEITHAHMLVVRSDSVPRNDATIPHTPPL